MNKTKKIFITAVLLLTSLLMINIPSMAASTSTPSKVIGLTVKIKNEKAYVNWVSLSDENIDGYEVHVYVPGHGYSKLGTVTKNRATIKGFSKNTDYKVKVRAYKKVNGSQKNGPFSNEITINIKDDKEETTNTKLEVKGLNAKVEGTTVTLKWDKVENAVGYQIYYTTPGLGYTIINTTKPEREIVGLTETKYNYTAKVRAYGYVDGKLEFGEYCKEVEFKAEGEEKPNKVTGLTVKQKNKKAYLNWVSVSNADGYEVYAYVPGRGYSSIGSTTKNSAKVSGFSENVTYKVKILSYKYVDHTKVYAESYSNEVNVKF